MTYNNQASEFFLTIRGILTSVACCICCLFCTYCYNFKCINNRTSDAKGKNKRVTSDVHIEGEKCFSVKRRNVTSNCCISQVEANIETHNLLTKKEGHEEENKHKEKNKNIHEILKKEEENVPKRENLYCFNSDNTFKSWINNGILKEPIINYKNKSMLCTKNGETEIDEKLSASDNGELKEKSILDNYSKNKSNWANNSSSFILSEKSDTMKCHEMKNSNVYNSVRLGSVTNATSIIRKNPQKNNRHDIFGSYDNHFIENNSCICENSSSEIIILTDSEKFRRSDIIYNDGHTFCDEKPLLKRAESFPLFYRNTKCVTKYTNHYKEHMVIPVKNNNNNKNKDRVKYIKNYKKNNSNDIYHAYSNSSFHSDKGTNLHTSTFKERVNNDIQARNHANLASSDYASYSDSNDINSNTKKWKPALLYNSMMPNEKIFRFYNVNENKKQCKSDNDDLHKCLIINAITSNTNENIFVEDCKTYDKKKSTENKKMPNSCILMKRKKKTKYNTMTKVLKKNCSEDNFLNKNKKLNKHIFNRHSINNIPISSQYGHEKKKKSCDDIEIKNYANPFQFQQYFQHNKCQSNIFHPQILQQSNFEQNEEKKEELNIQNIQEKKKSEKIKSVEYISRLNSNFVSLLSYAKTQDNKKLYKKKIHNIINNKNNNHRKVNNDNNHNNNNNNNSKNNNDSDINNSSISSNNHYINKKKKKKSNTNLKSNWKNNNYEESNSDKALSKCKNDFAVVNKKAVDKSRFFVSNRFTSENLTGKFVKHCEVLNSCDNSYVIQNETVEKKNLNDEFLQKKNIDETTDDHCMLNIFSSELHKKKIDRLNLSLLEIKRKKHKQTTNEKKKKNVLKNTKRHNFAISLPTSSGIPSQIVSTELKSYCNIEEKKKQNIVQLNKGKNSLWNNKSYNIVSMSQTNDSGLNSSVNLSKVEKPKNVEKIIFEYLQNSISEYNLGTSNKIPEFINTKKVDGFGDDILIANVKPNCQKNKSIINHLKEKLIKSCENSTKIVVKTNENDKEQVRDTYVKERKKNVNKKKKEKEKEKEKENENENEKKQNEEDVNNGQITKPLKNKKSLENEKTSRNCKRAKQVEDETYIEKSANEKEKKGVELEVDYCEKIKEINNELLKTNFKIENNKRQRKKIEIEKEEKTEEKKEEEEEKKEEEEEEEEEEKEKEKEKEEEKEKEQNNEKKKINNSSKRKIKNKETDESYSKKKLKKVLTQSGNSTPSVFINNSVSSTKNRSRNISEKTSKPKENVNFNKNEDTVFLNNREKLKIFCKKFKEIDVFRCASGLATFLICKILKQKEEKFEDLLNFILKLKNVYKMSTPDFVELFLILESINSEILKKYPVRECLLVALHFLKNGSTNKNIKNLIKILKLDNSIVVNVTASFNMHKQQIDVTEAEIDRILKILSDVVIRRSSRIKQISKTNDERSNSKEKQKKEEVLGSCWDSILSHN